MTSTKARINGGPSLSVPCNHKTSVRMSDRGFVYLFAPHAFGMELALLRVGRVEPLLQLPLLMFMGSLGRHPFQRPAGP